MGEGGGVVGCRCDLYGIVGVRMKERKSGVAD